MSDDPRTIHTVHQSTIETLTVVGEEPHDGTPGDRCENLMRRVVDGDDLVGRVVWRHFGTWEKCSHTASDTVEYDLC